MAGYGVDCAATSAEALARLDCEEYQLVLADLSGESDGAGARLLSYARQKDFRPATALLTSTLSPDAFQPPAVRMSDDNVSFLLARIAELIGERADRRMRETLRRVS